MNKTENWSFGFFEDMVKRGLISTGSLWIEKAIEQKHSQLSIAIADSRILIYDSMDRKLLKLINLN
jgi:hypothetical protein